MQTLIEQNFGLLCTLNGRLNVHRRNRCVITLTATYPQGARTYRFNNTEFLAQYTEFEKEINLYKAPSSHLLQPNFTLLCCISVCFSLSLFRSTKQSTALKFWASLYRFAHFSPIYTAYPSIILCSFLRFWHKIARCSQNGLWDKYQRWTASFPGDCKTIFLF